MESNARIKTPPEHGAGQGIAVCGISIYFYVFYVYPDLTGFAGTLRSATRSIITTQAGDAHGC
jgi:hypothetical protein